MTNKKMGAIEISYQFLGNIDEEKDAQLEKIMGRTCDSSGASVSGKLIHHLTWYRKKRSTMMKARIKARKLGLKGLKFTFWPY